MRVFARRILVVLERYLGIFDDGFLAVAVAHDMEFHETARGLLGHLIVVFAAGDAFQRIVLRDVDALAGKFDAGLVGRQGRDAAHIRAVLVLGHATVLDGAHEQVEIIVLYYRFRLGLGLRNGVNAAYSHGHHRDHRDGQDEKFF